MTISLTKLDNLMEELHGIVESYGTTKGLYTVVRIANHPEKRGVSTTRKEEIRGARCNQRTLSSMVDRGLLQQDSRGIYTLTPLGGTVILRLSHLFADNH